MLTMMHGRKPRAPILVSTLSGLLLLALTGCSVFTSYPEAVRNAQGAFATGEYRRAAQAMEKSSPPAGDRVLYRLELGTFQHTEGKYDASTISFREAVDAMKEYDERAVINVRDASAAAATLFLNDKTLPYRGAPFERILAHTFLAVNYLMQRDLEGARVEILQAYEKQKEAREAHEKAIAESQREAAGRRLDTSAIMGRLQGAYADQRALLQKAGNVYQNAFNYYLSSLVYEMHGDLSEAYIDAKTVHALNPNFLPTRRDLLRYSKAMGLADDYENWRRTFGPDLPDAPAPGQGDVIVLFECGLAPVREEIKIALPIPLNSHWTLVTIALPKYRSQYNPVDHANLVVGADTVTATQPLMDVEATAVRDLWNQAAGIAIRTLVRASSRAVAAEYARQQGGDLAFIPFLIFGYIVEQADLRCWMSLPREFQACRTSLPAGLHRMEVQLMGGGQTLGRFALGEVAVREGGFTLIRVRSTGVRGTATTVTLP